MKKKIKNKGFTLIELLAVIVILAIIALIAIPVIMNVINDAQKGAAKDSMYAYVKAVELASSKNMKSDINLLSGTYETRDGNLYNDTIKILDVDLNGTKPEDKGTIILNKGQVTNAILKFSGYNIEYSNGEVGEYKPKVYTVGEEVYFDPTGAVSDCRSGQEWTLSNTTTTCYKWNVLKDNLDSIEMMLDHNFGKSVIWVTKEDYIGAGGIESDYGSFGSNKYGPITLIKQLNKDTISWIKVETLTNADNVIREVPNTQYTINYNGMKARLISGQEVANAADSTKWRPTGGDTSISKAPWLYQNLGWSSIATQPSAYWTDTAIKNKNSNAWNVTSNGYLDYTNSSITNTGKGIRPVVRVKKSNIETD